MKEIDIYEEITALVDGEIKDEKRIEFLLKRMKSDEKLLEEYLLQKEVKSLLKKKSSYSFAPEYLYDRILSKLHPPGNSGNK